MFLLFSIIAFAAAWFERKDVMRCVGFILIAIMMLIVNAAL